MSRFDGARWSRIMVWTGASLAWGAALTAADLEPSRAEVIEPEPLSTVEVSTSVPAALPVAPNRGLVILRYTPSEAPQAKVQTVYVQRPAASPAPAAGPSAPPPPPPAPPAPKSSGS